jgi:glycosyltransferase involved in cell wall biosynthesis
MDNSPLVSVILPTYNREKYLQRSIGSVLSQTYSNWELIIWDDGSTDGTKEIVRSYNNPKIRYFFDKNRGANFARNSAIQNSDGKYIAFLDSDDEWVKEKLSEQAEVMKTFPEIDVLFSDFMNINNTTHKNQQTFTQYALVMNRLVVENIEESLFVIKKGIPDKLAIENFIATDTVLLRREILDKVGYFNTTLCRSEDFELWWRMGLENICFAYSTKVFLMRYKYPGSLSSFDGLTGCEDRLKMLDLCLQETLSKDRKDLNPYLNKMYRNTWQNMIAYYGREGDTQGMFNAFAEALRYGFQFGSLRLLLEGAFSCLKK